jgi:outer membrane protein assembly factor BamB
MTNRPLANRPLANRPLANRPLANRPLANRPLANRPLANRPLAKLVLLLGCWPLITSSACAPQPCPPWRPPLVVAMPQPPAWPPAKARAATGQRTCTDWSEVRGGPLRTGRSFCPGLRQPPTVRWWFDTGAPVIASPIVRRRWVYVGSTNGRLFALHRATGKQRWVFEAGSPVRAAVALQGHALFVGTKDGQLRCLDAQTGRVRWTHQSRYAIEHAPAVYGNVVLVGTSDGALTALDTRTGLHRWQFVTASAWHPSHNGGYTLAGIGGTPARVGNTIYFGSLGGHVHALAATSGRLRWGISTHWAVRSPPVVTSKGLWVSDRSGYVHALSRLNGARLTGIRSWYDKDISAPTLGDRGLYLATRSALLALRPSGHVRWKHKLGWGMHKLPRSEHHAPVLAGDVVYLNDRLGRLLAVDAKSGRLLWQRRATRGAFSPPAPVKEGLIVGSGDGRVYSLSARR